MKITPQFFAIVICTILFAGCSKNTDVPESREAKVARLLTGDGNKYWHIKEIYINGVKQSLSDAQMKYTKTYTADPSNSDPANPKTGTFVTSDGLNGKWKIRDTGSELYETFTNNPNGPVAIPYNINSISDTILDIEYLLNLTLQKEVYYAY